MVLVGARCRGEKVVKKDAGGQSHLHAWLHKAFRRLYFRLTLWGFDGRTTLSALRGFMAVRSDRKVFRKQRNSSRDPVSFPDGQTYFLYEDRWDNAGVAKGHYFHQDLFAARDIFERRPKRHIDVGSSIYGFVSHVASFREIEVLDIRPLDVDIPGIKFVQQDMTKLDDNWLGVTDSASCLHALEHFGLGRYGDLVDYEGWRKGLTSLVGLLKPGGILYLSVPTGKHQRVEFNAHRVFSLPQLRDVLLESMEIERLAFITDTGNLVPNVDPFGEDAECSFDANYGCSVWILKKSLG